MRAEHVDDVVAQLQSAHGNAPAGRTLEIAQRLLWIGRSLEAALDAVAASSGVPKRGDYDVLALMYRRQPESVNPKDIARELDLSSAGVTGRLDRLEGLGLLFRSPDDEDRRALRVSLTDDGREITEAVYQNNIDLYQNLADGLDETAINRLADALAAIHINVDQLNASTRGDRRRR